MSHQPFPSPSVDPFERLHIYDSLMMNAKRWLMSHDYHRRRQNLHYQSVNQPGIVCGLGIQLIEPPESASAKFRDRRWLKIQPGIAIDVEGNPIIVDRAINREFRIATETPLKGTLTVYLVVSYVEPENPDRKQESETIREWFRIDEKTSPPTPKEVEICRIEFSSSEVILQRPSDVFLPGINELDLRYRIKAKPRPEEVWRVAQMQHINTDDWYDSPMQKLSDRITENLTYLMQSVSALYPHFQGDSEVRSVNLQEVHNEIADYDLLYLADWQILHLNEEEIYNLNNYLNKGGVILIEAATNNSYVLETLQDIIKEQLEITLLSWQELSRKHPLRTQPFLFAAAPKINDREIEIWHGGGVVLIIGDLSSHWGIDDELLLDRNEIRTAQELGINIINFAWRRRQITELIE
ncbi:MAG TPA: DUF4159 domain-containing protein [Leptolyngbyaceae cyanobacterium]